MFNLSDNDNSAGGNSEVTKEDKDKTMNSLKNNLINCPAFLTGMSHEMRTHMNAIVAFSFLMKESDCNDPEKEDYSHQILSSCEQLISLFDSFFDSAIIDTSNSQTESKICKLDNILDDLLSEFREILKNEDHHLELITEIQYSKSLEVFIDTNRVFRVIRSLFQNSIKNTKSGYIKVGYYFRDDKLTFYVLDSGQGYFKSKEFLQSEDLNESLLSHNDTYTAVNIILAKKIINMLGGSIWIECNGLAGAGIYFSVPVKIAISSDIKSKKIINSMIAI